MTELKKKKKSTSQKRSAIFLHFSSVLWSYSFCCAFSSLFCHRFSYPHSSEWLPGSSWLQLGSVTRSLKHPAFTCNGEKNQFLLNKEILVFKTAWSLKVLLVKWQVYELMLKEGEAQGWEGPWLSMADGPWHRPRSAGWPWMGITFGCSWRYGVKLNITKGRL